MHAEVIFPTRLGQARIMLAPRELTENDPEAGEFGTNLRKGPLGNGVVLYLNIPDVDRYYEFVRKNGAIVDEPPKNQFWGDRTISVRTPEGYYLSFAAPIKGFAWPKQALESITDAKPATAPGTIRTPPRHAATRRKSGSTGRRKTQARRNTRRRSR